MPRAVHGVIYSGYFSPDSTADVENLSPPWSPSDSSSDSSSDEEMDRVPLQVTNSPRKRKAVDAASKTPAKKAKTKPAPKAGISDQQNDTATPNEETNSPKKAGKASISRSLPSARAAVISPEDAPVLLNCAEKLSMLRHIESMDKLAILQEENNSKELELNLTLAKAHLVQLQTDYAQTMERARTADRAFADGLQESLDNAADRFGKMFDSLASVIKAFSAVDNPDTLKLRAEADNARNELFKTFGMWLGHPVEFEAMISALRDEKKVTAVEKHTLMMEADALRYDSRERWVRGVSAQMSKVQPALVSLGGFQWRIMDLFLDIMGDKFPGIVAAVEEESALRKL